MSQEENEPAVETGSSEVTPGALLERVNQSIDALQDAEETVVRAAADVTTKRDEIIASNAAAPVPVWSGTSLTFVRGTDNSQLSSPVDLKGDTGAKGDPGVSPALSGTVNVETLAAGEDATASLTQAGNVYTLNLGIPQGAQGPQGVAPNNAVLTAGDQTMAGVKTFTDPPVLPAPTNQQASSPQGAPISWIKDQLRAEVEKASGGRNTVVRDAADNPNFFYVLPRFKVEDIDASLGTGTHPAFIVDGVTYSEILVGQYLASRSGGGLVQSLPRREPWCRINFETALAACRAMGPGFSLMTNVIYEALAMQLWKEKGGDDAESPEYFGNRNYGRDSTKHWQTGVLKAVTYAPGDTGNGDAATLTGTGPDEWRHDGSPFGIADLVGNVWEWSAGMRLVDGEIQLIPDNDAMLHTVTMGSESEEWKAVLQDGTLVAPGTADTLKFDGAAADTMPNWSNAGSFQLNSALVHQNVHGYYHLGAFKDCAAASGVTVPAILKLHGIYPFASKLQGLFDLCNLGERVPFRGGAWIHGAGAGPSALLLSNQRTGSYGSFGFRPALLS